MTELEDSYNWLREFVPLKTTKQQITNRELLGEVEMNLAAPKDCPHCRPWRSRAFDTLRYADASLKADEWVEQGRKMRFCRGCTRWRWVKRGLEEDSDE